MLNDINYLPFSLNRAFLSGFLAAAVLALGLLLPQSAVAQEGAPAKTAKPAVEEKEEAPRTGPIATRGTVTSSSAIDVDTGGSAPGDKPNVISGSVSPSGDRRCTALVSNQSTENTYKVRFLVEFTNSVSSKSESETFSATLRPEQTAKRVLRCDINNKMTLVLKSATAISRK